MKSGDVIKERQSPRREEVVGVDGRVNKNISKTFYVSFLSSQTDHIFYLEDLLSLDVRWKVQRSFLYLPVSRQGSNLSFKLFFLKKNIFTRLLNVLKKRQSKATNVFRLQTSYEPVRFERNPDPGAPLDQFYLSVSARISWTFALVKIYFYLHVFCVNDNMPLRAERLACHFKWEGRSRSLESSSMLNQYESWIVLFVFFCFVSFFSFFGYLSFSL